MDVSPQLPFYIEFFDDLQNVRGRSLNTLQAYRRDLEFWIDYKKNGKTVLGFYDYLKNNKLSPRSQARVISSLRTYLKYCEGRGMTAPELRELRQPKVKNALPKVLSFSEFEKLLSACTSPDENRSKRNQLTLLFLYGLGCRVSELIALDLNDLSLTERWIKILGKGKKERIVPLTDTLYQHCVNYIKDNRSSLIKENTNAILINDKGHRPSRVDIWRWLSAWSAKAGFDEPVNPHRFRHGCATALLESGADLRSIQMILGHSSIQTTQVYTNVTTQTLAKAVEENHPFSKIIEK